MRFPFVAAAISAALPFVHAATDGVGGSNACQAADEQLIQLLRRNFDESASLCGIPRRKVVTKVVTTTTKTAQVVRKVVHTTSTLNAGRKLKAREVEAEATGAVELLQPRADLDDPVKIELSDALGNFAKSAVFSACECLNQAFRIFTPPAGKRHKRSPTKGNLYLHQFPIFPILTHFLGDEEGAIEFSLTHGAEDPNLLWYTSGEAGLEGNVYNAYVPGYDYTVAPQNIIFFTPEIFDERQRTDGYEHLHWRINSTSNKISLLGAATGNLMLFICDVEYAEALWKVPGLAPKLHDGLQCEVADFFVEWL